MAGRPGADPDLAALLDDEALAAARRERRAAREGRDRARELATWVGALRDLVEREAAVQVTTDTGVAVAGHLIGLAADHLVLRPPGGGWTVVARAATTAVRETDPAAVSAAAAGDRTAPSDQALLHVLDRWREEAAVVTVVLRGGTTERGRLVVVGEDVISLATTGGVLHVAADAVVAVTVRP